ncbi:MAG: guanylate kinase, partial [Sphingomonadaceae bacterium]|nr:guanylate kinase [Sphingomonadaceae bacterium]
MADNETHKPYELERRGLLFVLSSPSGAGKSTLSRMLLDADENIALSVSYTTPPPRPGEIEGVHYHFTDVATFKQMAADGEFLEWAHVFGNRYGTPKGPV